jgi:CRP-like cAMP-binding protein
MKRVDHISPDLLDGTAFAEGLDDEERSRILQITERRHYDPDERIVREGEQSRDVFGLNAGQVKVTKRDEGGAERRLAVLEPGTVIGEIALVLGEPRSATVRATEEGAELLCIDGDQFREMLDDDDLAAYKVEHNILRMLGRRQSALNAELMDMMDPDEADDAASAPDVADLRDRLLDKWQM